jgi:FkbM family methyltransferase
LAQAWHPIVLLVHARQVLLIHLRPLTMVKKLAKNILWKLGIDLTQNMKYDRQTEKVIRRILRPDSGTIDIGCHKGEMLEKFIALSPQGRHYGFEPIPSFYRELKQKFESSTCTIYPYALARESGITEFNYVKNAPAYSGIKERKYAIEHPEIEKIKVELRPLDEIIPTGEKIDLIKIDVEGGELGVLQGASRVIGENRPFIVFECGLGAAEFYGTQPEQVFDLLHLTYGLNVSTMERWLKKETALNREQFCDRYNRQKDYYFMAYA